MFSGMSGISVRQQGKRYSIIINYSFNSFPISFEYRFDCDIVPHTLINRYERTRWSGIIAIFMKNAWVENKEQLQLRDILE